MSYANRLRRQQAQSCLAEQYLESGRCRTHESREAGVDGQQTIRPAVAIQGDTKRMSFRDWSRCQLPADTNQLEMVKISSSDTQGFSAQTATAMLAAGAREAMCDDAGDQRTAHKESGKSSPSTEDSGTRSSIASAEDAGPAWTGRVRVSSGPLLHFEAPKLSPQHADFLDVHSSDVHHHSLTLPARRDRSTPLNRSEEQGDAAIRRMRSLMAKVNTDVNAHSKAQQEPRVFTERGPNVASRRTPVDHGARLARTSNPDNWRDPRGALDGPFYFNGKLIRGEHMAAYLHRRDHGTDGRQLDHPQPPVSHSREAQPSEGNIVLGQARAVKLSRPGKSTLVNVAQRKPTPFDFGFLGNPETDLMLSAGAVVRYTRQTNVRTRGLRLRRVGSMTMDGAAEAESPVRHHRQSHIPRPVSTAETHTARLYRQAVARVAEDENRDVRFRQLVRRLEPNDHAVSPNAGRAPAQQVSRAIPLPMPSPKRLSLMPPASLRRAIGGNQTSSPEQEAGYFGLDGNPSLRDGDYSMLPSLFNFDAHPNPPPGNSGCPSLISDDGQEPYDFPDAEADERPRLPTSQGPLRVSSWEKEEDASTVLNDTSSVGSSTLVHIGQDEHEIFSMPDSEAIHDENIRADVIHAGVGESTSSKCGRLRSAYDNHTSAMRQQHRRKGVRAVHRADELTLYPIMALTRWLVSTNDAPGAPGMWHESSEEVELFVTTDEYQFRGGEESRAELLRLWRCHSGAAQIKPQTYEQARQIIVSLDPRAMPFRS